MRTAGALFLCLLGVGIGFQASGQMRCEQVFTADADDLARLSLEAPGRNLKADHFRASFIRRLLADPRKVSRELRSEMMEGALAYALSPEAARDPNLTLSYMMWSGQENYFIMNNRSGRVDLQSPYVLALKEVLKNPYFQSILRQVDLSKLTIGQRELLDNRVLFFNDLLSKIIESQTSVLEERVALSRPWSKIQSRDKFARLILRLTTPEIFQKPVRIGEILHLLQSLRESMTSEEFILTATEYVWQMNDMKLRNTDLPELPEQLIQRIIRESILREMGLPHKLVQDIVVTRPESREDDVAVTLLTGKPILGSKNYWGFSVRVLGQRSASQRFTEDYTWKFAGEKSRARLQFQPLKIENLVPLKDSAPRYREMMADGRLGGMVLISKNMGGFATELGDYYLDYFTQRRYRIRTDRTLGFETARQEILQSIRKGEIDWMTRDGHAEINEDALLSLTNKVRIVEFEKGADVVKVVIPEESAMEGPLTTNLSFEELGEALRARRRPGNQLLYFDSACFASENSENLIGYVSSPGFTPVASKEAQDTFTSTPGSSVFEFLEGMSARRSYAEINARVKNAKFVFPNDDNYIGDAEAILPMQLKITRGFKTLMKADGE